MPMQITGSMKRFSCYPPSTGWTAFLAYAQFFFFRAHFAKRLFCPPPPLYNAHTSESSIWKPSGREYRIYIYHSFIANGTAHNAHSYTASQPFSPCKNKPHTTAVLCVFRTYTAQKQNSPPPPDVLSFLWETTWAGNNAKHHSLGPRIARNAYRSMASLYDMRYLECTLPPPSLSPPSPSIHRPSHFFSLPHPPRTAPASTARNTPAPSKKAPSRPSP